MTFYPINSPYQIFTDLDGDPLEAGYIWIGEAYQNPITNPIDLFWDFDLSSPAAQPVRTIGGYISRNGSPGKLLIRPTVNNLFSITVQDKNGSIIFADQAAKSSVDSGIAGHLNVRAFGATGSGDIDEYDAFASALQFMDTYGYYVLYVPAGQYLLSQTILLENRGYTIYGDGIINTVTVTSPTRLIATHSSGPVIRIQTENCRIADLMVGASSARNTGAAGYNFGIQAEGEDTTSGAVRGTIIERVRIAEQPNTGCLVVGEAVSSRISDCSFDQNAGHGLSINRGEESGRTNQTSPPGIIIVDNLRCNRNGGHGIAAGHPSAISLPSYRVHVRNYEGFQNATDASFRHQSYDTYFHSDNGHIVTCAFGGNLVVGGLYVLGRTIRIIGCRYIKCTQPAEVGYLSASLVTRDIFFDGFEVRDTGPFNPAIIVDNSAINVKAVSGSTTNVQNLINENSTDGGLSFFVDEFNFNGQVKGFNGLFKWHQTIGRTQVQDDDVIMIDTGQEFFGTVLIFSANVSTTPSGMVHLRGTSNSPGLQSAIISVSNPGIFAVTTGALTGTTGTDGFVTISVDANGVIYIENRIGADRSFSALLIGGY